MVDKENPWNFDEDADSDEPHKESDDTDSNDDIFNDPWELPAGYIPDIHTKRLNEIIHFGYPGKEGDETRTGGIVCPNALDLSWRRIKQMNSRWSKARTQRISMYHGLRILHHDGIVIKTIKMGNKLLIISQNLDDDDLARALAERKPFEFRDPQPKTTSMGTLKILIGPISTLADGIGIAVSNMYPLLSIVSIRTFQPALWAPLLDKEYRELRRMIEARLDRLEKEYRRVLPK